jgi:uncharacterized membrane protein YqaE (UPF0057 family)
MTAGQSLILNVIIKLSHHFFLPFFCVSLPQGKANKLIEIMLFHLLQVHGIVTHQCQSYG